MNKVRIIIKNTMQPPIDTPASISHMTVVVESEELYNALQSDRYNYPQVIGAEIIERQNKEETE